MAARDEAGPATRVVLVGAPNTGKSSLFNALAGAKALVSSQAGTTRDYLVAELDLNGVKCQLIDTAGLAPGGNPDDAPLHHAAQAAASQQARRAQIRVLCLDATRPLNTWEESQLADRAGPRIVVLTKTDAGPPVADLPVDVATSSVTGQGLDTLRQVLRRVLLADSGPPAVSATAARCRDSLHRASECLILARRIVQEGSGEELVAAEVRSALDELGRIVGAVYTDDVLDAIFHRFCIGK
jgi:tRNA modification GTPase